MWARRWRSAQFGLGLLLGLAAPVAIGEAYLRVQPPSDIHLYLGEQSPLRGPFRPDPVLGAAYASYDTFHESYAKRLDELGPLQSTQPTWLFFGSSFVQAPGMLGDTMRALRPAERIFYLQRNEPPHVRIAQLRLLLEQGLRPRRVFFVLLPLDISVYGTTPLSMINATSKGAAIERVRLPEAPLRAVVERSRLALAAWVRSGRHRANPSFRPTHVRSGLSAQHAGDWRRLLDEIGNLSRRFETPVTLVLVPDRDQVFEGRAQEPQQTMAQIGRLAGLDVLDVKEPFLSATDKRSLYLPDWHYTPRGNAILAAAIIEHIQKLEAAPADFVQVRQ